MDIIDRIRKEFAEILDKYNAELYIDDFGKTIQVSIPSSDDTSETHILCKGISDNREESIVGLDLLASIEKY